MVTKESMLLSRQQRKAFKLLMVMLLLFVTSFVYFVYRYYSPQNLDATGAQLIAFERNGDIVEIVSDYDIPLLTTVRYTTDGSVPTKDSTKYESGIEINNSGRNGTVIRAAVFRGNKSTRVYTKTFFTGDSVLNDGIYTVCISTDADNLYSQDKGILALGADTIEEANANENLPKNPADNRRANYYGRGIEWERPANIEIYSSDNVEILNKKVGIRVTGANSRAYPVKSLRVYARSEYDGKGTFDLDIFDQYTYELGNKVTTYNHLDLRMGANNFYYTMLPDTLMRQIAYDGGLDAVGTAVPAVVYINGEYYTLVWLQPDYCGRNYAEMTGLDGNSFVRTVKGFEGSLTDGTEEGYLDFKEMYEFATSADFTIPSEREKLEKLLDIDNTLMYYFLQMYSDNNDWPTNNYGRWRCVDPANSDPENKYADGRWRFMFYDLDNAFSSYTDHTEGFDFLLGVKISPLFTSLMRSEEYRQRFVNIVCDMMSTATKEENVYDTYTKMKDIIEPEMQWRFENSNPVDFDEAYVAITYIRLENHIETKQEIVDQRLRDYFGARQKYTLQIDSVPTGAKVQLNTREITSGNDYDGYYYKEIPASLSCQLADGYEFDCWIIDGVSHYEKDILLDSTIVAGNDCKISLKVKKSVSDAKMKDLSWGSIARFVDICNPGTEDINLGEYSISEDKTLAGYALPQVILKPGETFRIYFTDDRTATLGAYICGINIKEGKTIYLFKNGQATDYVFVPQFIEGYILGKSESDGSWKYLRIKEEG